MDTRLYNDWIQHDLDGMIYVDRLGGRSSEREFTCQVGGCACRYHVKYTSGVIEKGEYWVGLDELNIDKVESQKDISKKLLEEGDIPDGLRVAIRSESSNINKRWESLREEDENQRKALC